MANFKPLRGDYAADQALYTVEADAYEPNDYNLYNMAGNVAEWVDTSYDPASYEYMSSYNPNVNDSSNDRKVIRGGSWKDVAYFLQVKFEIMNMQIQLEVILDSEQFKITWRRCNFYRIQQLKTL